MPGFSTELEHELTPEEAFERLRSFGDRMRESYSAHVSELTEVWHDDGRFEFAFKVMGMSIQGNMISEAERIVVQGSIPFTALPFRGQLENEIRAQLKEALHND